MRRINTAVAVAVATGALITLAVITVRSEESNDVVVAIHRYEEAAKHGTPAERDLALSRLMNLLKQSEGR